VKETEETGRADGVNTVSDLFWDVWNANTGYALPEEDDQDKCFTFDVCSRRFPHVVRHGDEEGQARERIVLHSVRDLNTLVRLPSLSLWMSADLMRRYVRVRVQKELNPEPFAAKYGWETVHIMPISDLLAQQSDGTRVALMWLSVT
jgi:hypothetical protein